MPRSIAPAASLLDLIVHVVPRASAETQQKLARTTNMRRAFADEVIISQGDPVQLTLVTKGYVSFRRTTAAGRELALGVVTRGRLFGFSSLAAAAAAADVVALTDAEFAVWPGRELRQMASADGGLALDIIDGMSGLVVDITERLDGFIHQNARERVLRVLARYADLFFGPSAVLSRRHLPSLVGTSREMTGRVIRDLEREGVIVRSGRSRLRLLSPVRLGDVAEALAKENP
jgi:CRP/FNR family cyclic AMP-dependent transcriptional regulator